MSPPRQDKGDTTTMTAATTWPAPRSHTTITTQRPSLNIAPRPKPRRNPHQPPLGSGQYQP
eukprot:3126746-Prorocentrum_lima.AAC.1